jgi:methylated-DNA-protein-cysteine methyltransferase-like protein
MSMTPSFRDQVYEVVRRIPRGKVATYGQIARLLGQPRAAREVGWALRDSPDGLDVPWQRVINAQGRVSFPAGSEGAALQRAMLEDEGVVFGPDGSVNLKIYAWQGLDLGEQQEVLAGDAAAEAEARQLTLGL